MTSQRPDDLTALKFPTLQEAEEFLRNKKNDQSKKSKEILVVMDAKYSAKELCAFQKVLHEDEQILISFRDAVEELCARKGAGPCDPKQLKAVNDNCEKLITEVRFFDDRLDKKRKELEAKEEKKEFSILTFFSLSLLFPSAAGTVVKILRPDDPTMPKVAAACVGAIGLGIHFRENILTAWKKASTIADEKTLDCSLALYSSALFVKCKMQKSIGAINDASLICCIKMQEVDRAFDGRVKKVKSLIFRQSPSEPKATKKTKQSWEEGRQRLILGEGFLLHYPK